MGNIYYATNVYFISRIVFLILACFIHFFIVYFICKSIKRHKGLDWGIGDFFGVLFLGAIWIVFCALRTAEPQSRKDARCPSCGFLTYRNVVFCPRCTKKIIYDGLPVYNETVEDEQENTIDKVGYCKNCGYPLEEGSNICSYCYTKQNLRIYTDCNANVTKDADFYPNCGKKLKNTCDNCGQILGSESKYCPNCGESVENNV